jgi:RNA polymerase sigma factor (TIGR02999 family)
MYPIVYEELKRLARRHLRSSNSPTLSTTDLVHEAFLRLRSEPRDGWEGRAHFFGAASRAMRQILVAFARRRRRLKRGGTARRVSLSEAATGLEVQVDEVIALDDALDKLDPVNPRLRQIVELRFFAGLSASEVSEILGVTTRTVERDWLKARLILLRSLSEA